MTGRPKTSSISERKSSGRRLQSARKTLNLTQKQLADALGCALYTVKSYEAGRLMPSGKVLSGLARLGINPSWVLKNEGAMRFASSDSRSDEALWHAASNAPSAHGAFTAFRRIRDAADLVQRIQKEEKFEAPREVASVMLELLATGQITEQAARRFIVGLKLMIGQKSRPPRRTKT